jgi:hypothetical protein
MWLFILIWTISFIIIICILANAIAKINTKLEHHNSAISDLYNYLLKIEKERSENKIK